MELGPADPILALAPLFHITGLVGHGILSLLVPAPLVLGHRFHPAVMLDAIREHRPVFTIGAITAFTALAAAPGRTPEDFASLTRIWTGGAPVAPAVADKLEGELGRYVHNAYGLTETSSVTHAVPPGRRAPVDPTSGALSIGLPVASVHSRIVGDDGVELPPGEVGEVLIAGPQVARGYRGRPDATAASFPGGELHTGDVGFRDEDGWFYLVDRKKDMIIAAGYKVWPREVEDVLYSHPAVREAAVIGVPDDYRGETVHAFVSLQPGASVTEAELIEFCQAQMAAYKYPRAVFLVAELPKTASGKILRRELRD
jgi:long-chain acyl-CoA synthetase